jgi:hypothetical protein
MIHPSSHYKRMWFLSHKKHQLMTYLWSKLCGFIHYNVKYGVIIVAYITLKWQLRNGTYYICMRGKCKHQTTYNECKCKALDTHVVSANVQAPNNKYNECKCHKLLTNKLGFLYLVVWAWGTGAVWVL